MTEKKKHAAPFRGAGPEQEPVQTPPGETPPVPERTPEPEGIPQSEGVPECGKSSPEDAASAAKPGTVPSQEPEAPLQDETARLLAEAEDRFLRLAAEYDNYRKRTAREKESAWLDSKIQTVSTFLPVYDNLERAMKQSTADAAYAKGVEMTMKGLRDVLAQLDVEAIPALGEVFDPNLHSAVMHVEDESAGENTVVEVFQQGFRCGDRVVRFAMVKVAN